MARFLLGAVILTVGTVGLAVASGPRRPPSRPLLDDAQQVAKWLRSVGVRTTDGLAWPQTPGTPNAQPISNLYSGSAGVVLFFLELHNATGDARDLDTARAGADWIAAQIDREKQP